MTKRVTIPNREFADNGFIDLQWFGTDTMVIILQECLASEFSELARVLVPKALIQSFMILVAEGIVGLERALHSNFFYSSQQFVPNMLTYVHVRLAPRYPHPPI